MTLDSKVKVKPHKWHPIKRKKRPNYVVFFDTETTQDQLEDGSLEHTLNLGHAIYCTTGKGNKLKPRSQITFTSSQRLWQWVTNKTRDKTTTYLVAHNIGFDLSVTNAFYRLSKLGWQRRSLYLSGVVAIIVWKQGNKKLIAINNTNLFPGKLATWGDVLNFPKLPVDFNGEFEQLQTYCIRDCEIMVKLWNEWIGFLDEHRICQFKHTISATAFAFYRQNFMVKDVWVHTEDHIIQLERKAYSGGRTEAFRIGQIPGKIFYSLDINSMYPYVMKTEQYPFKLSQYGENISIQRLGDWLQHDAVIAEVDIEVNENWYPTKVAIYELEHTKQPYIEQLLEDTHKGFTCYPLGLFKAILTTNELILALERGWIKHVHKAARYKQDYIFSDYVDWFYPLKQYYSETGNRAYHSIIKLLGNGLYGKTGQTGMYEQVIRSDHDPLIVSINDHYSAARKQWGDRIILGGVETHRYSDGNAYNAFVSIAAHVTANARILLNQYRLLAGKENVYYTDTDSLWTNQVGYKNLSPKIDPYRLGALKVEKTAYNLTIHAPKDYQYDDIRVIKGVAGQAHQLNDSTFLQWRWPSVKGLIRQGRLDRYRHHPVVKQLRREIRSGFPQGDGWVRPFVLPFHLTHSQRDQFARHRADQLLYGID